MTKLQRGLYAALTESYANYTTHGARSTRKLHPLHRFLADEIESIWGAGYETHYLGENRREFCVSGKYYNKNVDIVTVKDGVAVFGLGIKFVTSNYAQNSNNYFENMMGETANIQRVDVPYAQAIFLRDPMPYFKRGGEVLKNERVSAHQLRKYVELAFDQSGSIRPFATCLELMQINKLKAIKPTRLDAEIHGKVFVELYERYFSVESLLKKIADFKIFYEYSRIKSELNAPSRVNTFRFRENLR